MSWYCQVRMPRNQLSLTKSAYKIKFYAHKQNFFLIYDSIYLYMGVCKLLLLLLLLFYFLDWTKDAVCVLILSSQCSVKSTITGEISL